MNMNISSSNNNGFRKASHPGDSLLLTDMHSDWSIKCASISLGIIHIHSMKSNKPN